MRFKIFASALLLIPFASAQELQIERGKEYRDAFKTEIRDSHLDKTWKQENAREWENVFSVRLIRPDLQHKYAESLRRVRQQTNTFHFQKMVRKIRLHQQRENALPSTMRERGGRGQVFRRFGEME